MKQFQTYSSGNINVKSDLRSSQNIFLETCSSGSIAAKGIQCTNISLSTNSSGNIATGHVQCRNLKAVTCSSGDIHLKTVHCESTELATHSSGCCNITSLSCTGHVKATTLSSGSIAVKGHCQSAYYQANSSGCIWAKELRANEVTAQTNSCGEISCCAQQTLSAHAYSSGRICYVGQPSHITTSEKGVYKM